MLVALAGAGAAAPAMAQSPVTIDFTGVPTGPFARYSENGFAVQASLAAGWSGNYGYGAPAPDIEFTTPKHTTKSAAIRVTEGKSVFTFTSVDLYSSVDSITYRFRGLLKGKQVFSVTGQTGLLYGDYYTFVNIYPYVQAAIDTLEIGIQDPGRCCNNPVGIDNIVVVPGGAAAAAHRVPPS